MRGYFDNVTIKKEMRQKVLSMIDEPNIYSKLTMSPKDKKEVVKLLFADNEYNQPLRRTVEDEVIRKVNKHALNLIREMASQMCLLIGENFYLDKTKRGK